MSEAAAAAQPNAGWKWFTFIRENNNYANALLLAHNVLPFFVVVWVRSFLFFPLLLSIYHHFTLSLRTATSNLDNIVSKLKKRFNSILLFFSLSDGISFISRSWNTYKKRTIQRPQLLTWNHVSNCIIKKICVFSIKTVFFSMSKQSQRRRRRWRRRRWWRQQQRNCDAIQIYQQTNSHQWKKMVLLMFYVFTPFADFPMRQPII